MTTPVSILSRSGIQRDGTRFHTDYYLDGRWCRFTEGSPRKMLGYSTIASGTVPMLTYGMNSFSTGGFHYVHGVSESDIQQYRLTPLGGLALQTDRTPGGFPSSPNNVGQVDHFYDSVAVSTQVVVHAAPNLEDIDSEVATEIWVGDVDSAAALTDSGLPPVSGGAVVLGPYLFSYGSSGRIGWSAPNDYTTLDAEAFVTPQKVIRGIPLRGSQGGPAGLFWSLDSLIRATFVGGATVWNFDTISSELSILSSRGMIEYDGIYYWAGVDRFMAFNGVVREVPNTLNSDWFFDGLNFQQRQKVYAFKVPRFGEIWWCYPRGSATECTHAVILNVREGTWYDTPLPNDGRSDGIYAKVFNRPLMFGVEVNPNHGGYNLWQHETGYDEADGVVVNAIQSYFETSEKNMLKGEDPVSKTLAVERIEFDSLQSGELRLRVRGRSNAKSPEVQSDEYIIPETASTPADETVKMRESRRLMSFRVESNVAGGFYDIGNPIAHIAPTDGRVES